MGEAALAQAMIDLKRQHSTVLIISHRLSVLGVVDKILVLREGQAQMFGPSDQVLAQFIRPVAAPVGNPRRAVKASRARWRQSSPSVRPGHPERGAPMSQTLTQPPLQLAEDSGDSPAPTDDRPIRWIGFLILLAAFGGFGGWATTAQIDSAAVAPGTVTVESYRKTVQHLEGGIVKDILVRDGDAVQEGDVLLRLDGTQARAQLEIARVQYYSTLALESRLLAERNQAETITIPDTLKQEEQDPRVCEAIQVEQQTFNARRTAIKGEVSLFRQRIEQLQEQMRGLDALSKSKQQRIVSYTSEASDFGELAKRGFSDKLRSMNWSAPLLNWKANALNTCRIFPAPVADQRDGIANSAGAEEATDRGGRTVA